jgi:hypothetical protein
VSRAKACTRAAAWALAVGVLLCPANAPAMEPARAGADAAAAMKERGFTFCSDPRKPLSYDARSLCPHAAETPDCGGFVAACAPEKAEDDGNWFTRFLEKLAKAVAEMTPDFVKSLLGALAELPKVVFLGLVGLILGIAVVVAARSIRRSRRDAALREEKGPATPQEALADAIETTEAEALLALAGEHASRGESDLALQLYLAAGLRALDHRGAIAWAKNRTNGEYVRSCKEEAAKSPLRELVRENDQVQFGRVPASQDVVARAAQLAAGLVRLVPLVMLVLALPALLACSGTGLSHHAGDDPAGDDLLREVLRRQGVTVSGLDGPLGELSTGDADGKRAVLVDVESTPMDDDTREHLASWVHAGGVLVLAGAPEAWPKVFAAERKATTAKEVAVPIPVPRPGAKEPATIPAHLVNPWALEVRPDIGDDELDGPDDRPEDLEPVATFADGSTYAAIWPSGSGVVLGIGTDELLTNAALARPGNAYALMTILAHANRDAIAIAEPEDGSGGTSSPISALQHAGLGLALGQSAAALAVLFLALGVRLMAPRPPSPARRRAFAEHVEAVGALYARTGAARHALAAYARFVEQRLRARMPRGTQDVAAFLAARSQLPLETCERLFKAGPFVTAAAAPSAEPARKASAAEDLMILKDLSAAYAAATARDP